LIRLAVEAGRKFTRDYLVDLLWSDAPPQRASHSLAQAISVLKAKVGREHVFVQKATVALADGVVDADVRRLDGRNVEIRGPFLDGFEVPGAASFEQWKDEWRARLMAQLRDCLVKQMDAGRRIGDFGTVERHALVLHDLDPLSEDAVRGLMEARAWVGDRTNALKAFGRFEARLDEELGAKPSPDLVRIANLLREGKRSPQRREGAEAAPARREQRFEAETLVGREREFSALYDAWLQVRQRTPRIVLVTGDPGIGKTTLTNAFLSTCQMEGAVVARAQAYEAERELPFAVLAELVKQLTLQRAIGGADPEALAELSRVSPEVFQVFPGVPKPPQWSAEVMPLRLADSFLKATEAAAEETPIVLVVDDIHASDNASAAILHMVARKLPRTRLLLILTGRPSELRMAAAPAALVTDSTVEALRPLELEPLGPQAAAQLVAAVATGGDASRGDPPTQRILRASRGNPLAIELLTREWASQEPSSLLRDLEAMDTQPVASLGIPRAIGAVFERQVRRLDATCRAALDLAAVLGRRLSDLLLYDAVNLNPGQTTEALARLTEEGLLREVRGELEFRNELIRAQAYYHVPSPARQHLHRRVARLLADRPVREGYSDRLEIGWHFVRGSDTSEALVHALDGAEAALSVGAPFEAEQILTVLAQELTAHQNMKRVGLLLARSLMDQSKAVAAKAALQPLLSDPSLSLRETAEATGMEAAAEYLLAGQTGHLHSQAAERALNAARATGDSEFLGQALIEYARSGIENGNEDRVQAAQSEIADLLRRPGSGNRGALHWARGFCHYFFCDAKSAAESFERAIKEGTLSNPVLLSLAYNGYGISRHCLCDFGGASEAFLRALELTSKVGDDSRASIINANLACSALYGGAYAEAIQYGLRSAELGVRSLTQPHLLAAYVNLAEACLLSGDPNKALKYWEQAAAWAADHATWRTRIEFLLESASFALALGNLTSALADIESVEKAAWNRERIISQPGMFEKLRAFRAYHASSPEDAVGIATRARERFRGRHPLYYLDAVAITAWLERQICGGYSSDTQKDLELFTTLEASGKRALLETQGFLR